MDLKKIVPQDKSDIQFITELSKYNIKEVKEIVPELLTWLQDYNWPPAEHVGNYLSKFTNEIDEQIISILKGNDDIWKYWVISTLVLHSDVIPNEHILEEVKRIADTPTLSEKEEEVDEIAQEAIEKYKN